MSKMAAKKNVKAEKVVESRSVEAAPALPVATDASAKKASVKKDAAKKPVAAAPVAPAAQPAAPVAKKSADKKADKKAALPAATAPVANAAEKKASAKKSKVDAVVAAPVVTKSNLAGPVRHGADSYFARADLHKIEMAQMKAKNAKQAAELQQARMDQFKAEVATKLAEATENLRKLAADYQAQAESVTQLYRDIEVVYGLDMTRTSYDPITGKIAILGQ